MSTATHMHRWKHWLPALMLLVVLALLTTSAHSHLEEESAVDCTLCCLQQNSVDELSVSNASLPFPSSLDNWATHELPAPVKTATAASYGIRAPPAFS